MHTVWAKLAWLTPCEPGSAKQRTKQALTTPQEPKVIAPRHTIRGQMRQEGDLLVMLVNPRGVR